MIFVSLALSFSFLHSLHGMAPEYRRKGVEQAMELYFQRPEVRDAGGGRIGFAVFRRMHKIMPHVMYVYI